MQNYTFFYFYKCGVREGKCLNFVNLPDLRTGCDDVRQSPTCNRATLYVRKDVPVFWHPLMTHFVQCTALPFLQRSVHCLTNYKRKPLTKLTRIKRHKGKPASFTYATQRKLCLGSYLLTRSTACLDLISHTFCMKYLQ